MNLQDIFNKISKRECMLYYKKESPTAKDIQEHNDCKKTLEFMNKELGYKLTENSNVEITEREKLLLATIEMFRAKQTSNTSNCFDNEIRKIQAIINSHFGINDRNEFSEILMAENLVSFTESYEDAENKYREYCAKLKG